MKRTTVDANDDRWGGYIPWFLRHHDYSGTGQFLLFFARISHRLNQLFIFNELGIQNIMHFGCIIESKSLQRFRFDISKTLATEIMNYFDPKTLSYEMKTRLDNDPEELELRNFYSGKRSIVTAKGLELKFIENIEGLKKEYQRLELKVRATREKRSEIHYRPIFLERLGVLEIILKIIPKETSWFKDLVQDIKMFFAEAGIMLDINPKTYCIVAIEEPLLQKAVLDNLLPRLNSRFPERSNELVALYHDMVSMKKFDEVFVSAYKTLEAIARDISGDKNFEFNQTFISKYFPKLHSTIQQTIIKLGAHRGDQGGHGRVAPESLEMRYLLFSICNIALLLLDYQ